MHNKPKLRVKRDYYGNKSFGKRAYWVLDQNNQTTGDFFFVDELHTMQKECDIEIIKDYETMK